MADEIGSQLREARMRAKIDINEVETRTKIRAKYLRAIENEEWDLLPGEVYVKSFLRTYGDFLGLDSRQLIDDYKRRYERPSDHELRPITPLGRERERERERRRRGGRMPPWVPIGLVLVAVVAALYFLGRPKGSSNSTTSTTTTVARHPRPRRGSRAKGRRRRPPTTVRLQLTATGPVWVCLVNGAGKQLIPGQIFNVGDPIPTKTAPKLMLTLGTGAVRMKVNGVTVPVAHSANPIGYELTPTSHTTLPAGQQ